MITIGPVHWRHWTEAVPQYFNGEELLLITGELVLRVEVVLGMPMVSYVTCHGNLIFLLQIL